MNLVAIPFHDWRKCEREGFRTRDAHLMKEFGQHPEVAKLLVIDRPISVAEMVFLRRNWHVRKGNSLLQNSRLRLTQVDSRTFVLDILVLEFLRPLIMKRHWTPYIFGQPKVVACVVTALDYLDMNVSPYVLFMSAPLFVPLVAALSPDLLAFDAQDNLLKHAFYRDVPRLEEYYEFCIENAGFLSANSLETTQWFSKKRPDAIHISNGVDPNVFNPSRRHTLPDDMRHIRPPIIGYAGKMQAMFDVQLMKQVMSALPESSFVFIGQELDARWTRPLWSFPNANYLGDKVYEDLPRYLAAFDVCIIPYDMEKQHGVDPIKFYEYLAMGKPVVTTRVGNVEALGDHALVQVANTTDDFIRGLRGFLRQVQREELPGSELSLPKEYTWHFKADYIIHEIERKLEKIASGNENR